MDDQRFDELDAKRKSSDQIDRLERLELKHQELETRLHQFSLEMTMMKRAYEDLASKYRELQSKSMRIVNETSVEELSDDFKSRVVLVETTHQDLTERVDSFQYKADCLENQLLQIQQRMNNVEITDEPMQTIERSTTNESVSIIEKTLCKPCEKQIKLSTDEIQYGIFDVCDKYKVIIMKEKDKLKLFNFERELDERPWGELGTKNYVTSIHWCSFLDSFLILYRFKLYTLSLKFDEKTSQYRFDQMNHIDSIRVYSLKHDKFDRGQFVEILRDITSSPNLADCLFLNRGYRRIERINTNSWKVVRGWSKQDLDYKNEEEIRSIICSLDGNYLTININWNEKIRFVDLRKTDNTMTLIKRIRMPDDSLSLRQRLELSFDRNQWLIVDEEPRLYLASNSKEDDRILPIRTTELQAISQTSIYLRLVDNDRYLFVASVIGDRLRKQGAFSFYKIPTE